MKCPYCKIHYMDDERRCPMCDRINPNFYQGKAKKVRPTGQSEKTYSSIRKKDTAAPRPVKQEQPSKSPKDKKKNTVGAVLGVVIAMIGVLAPVLETVADDVVSQVELWFQPKPEENIVDVSVETPLQEDIPQSAYEVLEGEWFSYDTADTYLYLNLTFQEYVYTPNAQTTSETGVVTVYENSVIEQDDGSPLYVYDVTFYPEAAEAYTLCIGGASDENTLFSMPYDDQGYPDTNQMTLWERTKSGGTA